MLDGLKKAGERYCELQQDVLPPQVMTTITCKISEKLNAHLDALARQRGVSKSAILREALENKTKSSAKSRALSAYDLVKHLCGRLRGPKDLSTNPGHMRGFGE
jgi:hypothetical protein